MNYKQSLPAAIANNANQIFSHFNGPNERKKLNVGPKKMIFHIFLFAETGKCILTVRRLNFRFKIRNS